MSDPSNVFQINHAFIDWIIKDNVAGCALNLMLEQLCVIKTKTPIWAKTLDCRPYTSFHPEYFSVLIKMSLLKYECTCMNICNEYLPKLTDVSISETSLGRLVNGIKSLDADFELRNCWKSREARASVPRSWQRQWGRCPWMVILVERRCDHHHHAIHEWFWWWWLMEYISVATACPNAHLHVKR